MNKPNSSGFKKAALSASITAALTIGASQQVQADIYEFSFSNGGCNVEGLLDLNSDGDYLDAGEIGNTCTSAGDAWFTMLDSAGIQLQNSSYPYYGDPTWGYGLRTQIAGTIALDVTNGKNTTIGGATINGFDFFASGAAAASSIEMKGVGDGVGGAGGLILANMGFSWNGSDITTQVVLDASGLLAEIPLDSDATGISLGSVFDSATCTDSGACVLPASDGIKKGNYPIGPVPIATSTFNTAGQTGLSTALADLSLGTDDGIGGSPMDNGPFSGFNANFDFGSLTLTGYNDTTPPVVSFSASSVSIALGGTFDPLNPGVTVTCSDRADGVGNKEAGALTSTNSKLTFAFNQADVDAIDSSVSGSYSVRYTCTDSALDRANGSTGVKTLPAGSAAPQDNTSAETVLSVLVADPDAPTIFITGDNPLQFEACSPYSDLGATATDPQDGDLSSSVIATDDNSVSGTNQLDGVVASFTYNVTDSSGLPAVPAVRGINFVDTVAPTLAVEVVAAGVTGIEVDGVTTFSIESKACDAFNASLPTATVSDTCSTPTQATVSASNIVNCDVLDGSDTVETTLLYSGTDGANTPNTGNTTAKVIVARSEPIATLVGDASVILEEVNGVVPAYVEQGVAIHDVQDGDVVATSSGTVQGILDGGAVGGDIAVTIEIKDASGTVVNSIDTSVTGSVYTITYDVTDSGGLSASRLERQVTVGAFATGSNFTMLNPQGNLAGGTNDVAVVWDGVSLNTDESDTNFDLMTLESAKPQPFFEYLWTAHHVRIFGEGSYTFDVTCTTEELEAGTTLCSDGVSRFVGNQTEQFLTMNVGPGQIGAHILFDWGRPNDPSKPETITPCGVASCDIDVVIVWDQNALWNQQSPLHLDEAGSPPDAESPWKLVSTDFDGDGANGAPMIDGPFIGFNANFNIGPAGVLSELPTVELQSDDTLLGEDGIGSMGLGLLSGLASLLGLGLFRRRK